MIKIYPLILLAIIFSVDIAAQSAASGKYHVAQEMPIYNAAEKQQRAGIPLNAPGDHYRYSYLIDNQYANNTNFVLEKATIGVHILDADYQADTGDMQPEWGQILLNGRAHHWIHYPAAKDYRLDEKPELTSLIEIVSDDETSGMPPYIFDVTQLLKIQKNKLVLDITNLREDGEIEGDAAFGDFTILRAGLHLYYKQVSP